MLKGTLQNLHRMLKHKELCLVALIEQIPSFKELEPTPYPLPDKEAAHIPSGARYHLLLKPIPHPSRGGSVTPYDLSTPPTSPGGTRQRGQG